MIQKFIYKNDITREIGDVVYSNDDRFLTQELEEYVLTRELLKPKLLPELFEALAKPKVNSSVWISGYYGSGKSHLLKMLSLVLNNQEVNQKKSADIFSAKATDDFVLQSNIKKATTFDNRTILFNIAAKAVGYDSSENFTDRVLMVFLKALNDSYNYHPTYPEIAEIERQMDVNQLFAPFKANYLQRTGKTWEEHRPDVAWHLSDFIQVYAQTRNISLEEARDIINQRNSYKIDIESFGKLVQKHCEKGNQRIVFCIDEVGQFIANDIDKMLSLQTIAENLAVQTDGKSLIIVTSQDDIDTTIGRFNQNQADTFSKIKARFLYRISLTGANADEVIQKRILEKNTESNGVLGQLYNKEKNIISTLFKFSEDSKGYKNYQSSEHFQNTFPFVPYQFNLFQDSIIELSKHDVFTGRSQSTGERSLIRVCHTVAKQMKDEKLDKVVTFPMMFDAIKHDFRSQVFSDIIAAERGILGPLAVDILKILFLVKYIKGFKANVNNITILLLPQFEVNLAVFHKEVQEALNKLEHDVYIQRTAGDLYEYLTNQEKDIEKEIKNTDIDVTATGDLLSSFLFDDILRDAKVRLESNNQPYEFGKKMDDNIVGRDKDFYLNFITPLNVNAITTANVAMFSMGKPNDLVVLLPDDNRLSRELTLFKQTDKYVLLNNNESLDSNKKRILSEKAQLNAERKRAIVAQLKEHIGDAKMYLNGSELTDIGSKDPKTKVNQGIQQLIELIYTHLKMLKGNYTEGDIKEIVLKRDDDVLLKSELHEVELEMLNRIQRNKTNNDRTTIKNLLDHFGARPYGWYQAAVLCLIARLYKRNKINLKQDSNNLDDKQVLEALQRNNQYNTIIELEEEIQNTQIKKLKDFHQEYFNEPNLGNEPKEISKAFKKRLEKEVNDLNDLYAQRHRLMFLESLGEPIKRLKAVAEREHLYFFNKLSEFEDNLLDDKENVLDNVKKFMSGQQRAILEQVLLYREGNRANFSYVQQDNLDTLSQVAESPTPYKGAQMQAAKVALEAIKEEVTTQQKLARDKATDEIQQAADKLKSFDEFNKLDNRQQNEMLKPFEEAINTVKNERFISNIQTKAATITNELYHKQLNLMMLFATPPPQPAPVAGVGEAGSPVPVQTPPKPKITYVNKNNVKVAYKKHTLVNEQDVDDYLAALKKEYLRIINDNKGISI